MGKQRKSEVAAIEVIKKQIKHAMAKGNMSEAAELYNQLGNQHRLLGNYEYAIDAHQEEINISRNYNAKDKMALGIAYRCMAEVLCEMKKIKEALAYIRLYLKLAQDVNNFVEQQRAHITMGRAYVASVDQDDSEEKDENSESHSNFNIDSATALRKAYECYKTAYKLLSEDELKDQVKDEKELEQMKCNNCHNLGIVFQLQGKLAEATNWLIKAVSIGGKFQFHENLAPCYTVLCEIQLKEGKWKEAITSAKEASKAAKALGNHVLEVESQMLEAKALFRGDEVDSGKKILKRLRQKVRKNKDLHGYSEELDAFLTAAVRVSRTQDILFVTEKEDAETRMKLYEILGDNYCTLKSFKLAIAQYQQAVKIALQLDITGKKLARLYFSIGETYNDLENYQAAYEYYIKEMEVYSGNPSEEFKTQTLITHVLEKLKKSSEETIEAHKLAVSYANMSKNPKKEVIALNNFSAYLKSIGKIQESERQMSKANDLKTRHNIRDTDDGEPDSQDLLEDDDDIIDLDNLSDEEDTDDETEDDRKTVKKRLNVRVNEAGESQLHVAAKKGDLKTVRKLIRQGHPVKRKDNAGWTPLHEACNFGHSEVVEELLKHGADVNDNGGAFVEKITPLHDAAGNGHCEVMRVLIKYGANVLARDAEGKYPIDSLLVWRESEEGRSCSEDELVAYREVKKMLKEYMAKAGKTFRDEDEKRSRKKARIRKTPPPSSRNEPILLVTKPHEVDCPIQGKIVIDDFDLDQEGIGTDFYKKAINQVGRKAVDNSANHKKERTRAMSPGPRTALIPSEKDFHQRHEDWLLPDDTIDAVPSTSKKQHNVSSKPKRKRDPLEDLLNERSTRRKTGNSRNKLRDEDEEEDISELMDIDSPPHFEATGGTASLPTNYAVSPDSNSIDNILNEDALADEDLNALLNDDFRLRDPLPDDDDFMPSQMPTSSSFEFGRTKDIPIVVSDDSDKEGTSVPRGRGRKSPTKRYGTISSDEDDTQMHPPRNKIRLADLSSVLRQANSNEIQRKERNFVQTKLKLPVKVVPRQRLNSTSSDESSGAPVRPQTNQPGRRTSSLTSQEVSVIEVPKKEVRRLKIQILDHALLVPVDENHINQTIDWLAQESANRYLRLYGVKPILSLQTKDGASLSGSDPISLVLDANERELNGVVTNFDLPPLTERYTSACKDKQVEPDTEINSSLLSCQSSNILNLTDACLRRSASVLMTALQRQTTLRTLVLSGCSLFDTGISELCKVLPTLSGLIELDISSNGITKAGFISFTEVFTHENPTNDSALPNCSLPLGITSLSLSHNPLGSQIGGALSNLLATLQALKRLEIADCNLSDKLLLSGKADLVKALNNSRLEELDISFNSFKDTGLERFLQSIPARRLRNLNCSSCASANNNSSSDGLAKAVCSLLSGNEDCCNLKTLQLNDCGLSDRSMELLLENFDRLVRLEDLQLACNDGLTASSLVKILECSVHREIPLTSLNMGSNPTLWSSLRVNNEQILTAVTQKLNSQYKIAVLRLPISEREPERANFSGDGSQPSLSNLEERLVEIFSDYAGNANFHYEKEGQCITYRLED